MDLKLQNCIFFDESGTDGDSKFLALGFLVIQDIVDFHNRLEKVRDKHNFRNEVKFEKTSNLRFEIAKKWLGIFFEFKKAHFYCFVFNKQKSNILSKNLKQWPKFKIYAKKFLNKYLKQKNIRFYFDSYSRVADKEFKEYLLIHVKNLKSAESIDSKDYDALQMCDLLLGATRASFEKTITSKYKKQLVKLIKLKMAVPPKAESKARFNYSIIKLN